MKKRNAKKPKISAGQLIKKLRLAQGLTQVQLARKAHISQVYLSELERDAKPVPLMTFVRLVHLLPFREETFAVDQPIFTYHLNELLRGTEFGVLKDFFAKFTNLIGLKFTCPVCHRIADFRSWDSISTVPDNQDPKIELLFICKECNDGMYMIRFFGLSSRLPGPGPHVFATGSVKEQGGLLQYQVTQERSSSQ
jgi:transcriptional regulator with XRE-family HTH domain